MSNQSLINNGYFISNLLNNCCSFYSSFYQTISNVYFSNKASFNPNAQRIYLYAELTLNKNNYNAHNRFNSNQCNLSLLEMIYSTNNDDDNNNYNEANGYFTELLSILDIICIMIYGYFNSIQSKLNQSLFDSKSKHSNYYYYGHGLLTEIIECYSQSTTLALEKNGFYHSLNPE